jgi:beta-glucanase (GH16 family)/peptidoglycan/xylan/chitin deacetylase (PgdA/CDA1 family)
MNFRTAIRTVALLCALSTASSWAAGPTPPAAAFAWPNGARAAVSLAYDDALDSQLDHAIPDLDRAGLKGSFYLQLSNPAVQQRMAEWRAAASHGHELGNHTLFHQCSHSKPDRSWVQPQRDLDTTTPEQMRDQVMLANTMLTAIDGRTERTLTVPCGDRLAASKDYVPGLHAAFVAMKAREGNGVVEAMATLDPYEVPVLAPVGLSGKELIAIVQRAVAKGTMVNFTFHGVGGDYLSTSSEAHRELLQYLAANRTTIWTDTFLNLMRHVKSQQSGWVLDWSDEFDGAALDHSKWVEETGGHGFGNNELEYYTDGGRNLRVNGGKLVIEARREDREGRHYTSARIKTAGLKERTYGRYEARIRIPRGQGIWPAFWLLGADCETTGWPRCGEIDIMENIGKEPGIVHGTLHGPGFSGDHGFGAPSSLDAGAYADDFHLYAVEWEPGEIRWYRDGILYHTARPDLVKGAWVYDHPFFVILNLAVGGYWPGNPDASTSFPQRMLVDYVRVYRRAASASAVSAASAAAGK